MTTLSRSRSGLSPLIATILLIAFAVALGAVVMNWGRNINVGENTQCNAISFDLNKKSVSNFCFESSSGQYVEAEVINKGKAQMNLFILLVTDKGLVRQIELSSPLEPKTKSIIKIPYKKTDIGNIRKIYMIPKITGDESDICLTETIDVDGLDTC